MKTWEELKQERYKNRPEKLAEIEKLADQDALEFFRGEVVRLSTALIELEGFAQRNLERAKKAEEAGKLRYHAIAEADELSALEAQRHQAERFYFVIRERVREALT